MGGGEFLRLKRSRQQQVYRIAGVVLGVFDARREIAECRGMIALQENPAAFRHDPVGEGGEVTPKSTRPRTRDLDSATAGTVGFRSSALGAIGAGSGCSAARACAAGACGCTATDVSVPGSGGAGSAAAPASLRRRPCVRLRRRRDGGACHAGDSGAGAASACTAASFCSRSCFSARSRSRSIFSCSTCRLSASVPIRRWRCWFLARHAHRLHGADDGDPDADDQDRPRHHGGGDPERPSGLQVIERNVGRTARAQPRDMALAAQVLGGFEGLAQRLGGPRRPSVPSSLRGFELPCTMLRTLPPGNPLARAV